MPRIVEAELMNNKVQAEAYANADFEQQVLAAGLTELKLKTISDRHIAIFGTKTG